MEAKGPTSELVAGDVPAVILSVHDLLRGVRSIEARLAVTVAVLVGSFVLALVVVPWLTRVLGESGADGTPDGEESGTARAVRSSVRLLFARGLQLEILIIAALTLLVVWGRIDEAYTLLADEQQMALLGNVAITVVVGLVAYVAVDVLNEMVVRFSEGADRVTDHQEEVIRRMGQLGIMALALFTVLTIWVEDLSGLLVGAGFLGIVVGMAARQTLGSLIAGLVLMFSRPFTIGDWVEIGDQEGIVTDITIVNTRLENFDGEFVVIPNDMVGNSPITNRSRKGHLRLRQQVGIDYEADPERARDVALEAMAAVDAIEDSPSPQAILTDFGDSAIAVELRFWIDRPTPPRKWHATNAVVQAVKTAFDREGIKIPFPQRELTGRAETGGFRVQGDARPRDRGSAGRTDGSRSDGASNSANGSGAAGEADEAEQAADSDETEQATGTDETEQAADADTDD